MAAILDECEGKALLGLLQQFREGIADELAVATETDLTS